MKTETKNWERHFRGKLEMVTLVYRITNYVLTHKLYNCFPWVNIYYSDIFSEINMKKFCQKIYSVCTKSTVSFFIEYF